MFTLRFGVRTRISAIALIPSLTLLVLGALTAGDLLRDSHRIRDWAEDIERVRPVATELLAAVQHERLLSLRRLTGDAELPELPTARLRVDQGFYALAQADSLRHVQANIPEQHAKFAGAITAVRAAVDSRRISPADAYAFFNAPYSLFNDGFRRAQQAAPDPMLATMVSEAVRLLSATEAMSRANAVAVALIGSNGRAFPLDEFHTRVGFYRAEIRNLATEFGEPRNAALVELTAGDAWRRLSEMETAVLERIHSKSSTTPAIAFDDWQAAATEVGDRLLAVYSGQHLYASDSAAAAARRAERSALLTAAIVATGSVVALLIAVLLANRIIRRLRRLRDATLAVADRQLPAAMRHAKTGAGSELDAAAPKLNFGRDEIGDVAKAFEYAASAALKSAVDEARTREGVQAVFVNIARRSQLVVHRQLEILDDAERGQADPALLDMLFKLDHLATRERRNAENLLILGGSRPDRQWRNPVPIIDILHGAIGETTDFTRVRLGTIPEVSLIGAVVADLVHLIAELVDNATGFSPPTAHVEVSGRFHSKRLVLEICDRGVGLSAADFHRYNELLTEPAEFGLSRLSEDSRMGLFVVARLASAHGVTVRLTESEYGGVRTVVRVPSTLLVLPQRPAVAYSGKHRQ
ncbi:nitrate- and nitrite sensing domain-containing protein [Nocardia sp. NPDC127579]|uniref:sensor histidine kinase n=1 Tax=Nocardia sp. NPDC127579 TaxID=3345402 RepID=UPI00362ABAE5